MPLLIHKKPDGTEKTLEFTNKPLIVGRLPESEISVRDSFISRVHCGFTFANSQFSLKDLGSTNGTYRNGARVFECALSSGDKIQVGNTTLGVRNRLEKQQRVPAADPADGRAAVDGRGLDATPPGPQTSDHAGEPAGKPAGITQRQAQVTFLRRPMIVARQPALLLFLAVWLMCFTSAPGRSEDSTNQIKSATDLARDKARQQRQNLPFTKGTLRDIDFLRHELRLATVDGVRTFTYTPQTYIFRDKAKVTVDQLKTGEIIALRFNTDNDGISTVVRIKAYGTPTAGAVPPGPSISTNQLPNTAP